MRNLLRRLTILVVAISSVGCTDTVGSPGPSVRPTLSSSPPEGAPPEFSTIPIIFDTWLDVGFLTSNPRAYAGGSMNFWGSHGKVDVTLTVREGSSVVETRTTNAEDFRYYPWRRTLFNHGNTLSLGATCGHTASGYASFSAWHEYLGDTWGRTTVPVTKSKRQGECTSCTGSLVVEYDPYAEGPEEGDCGGDDGSGSGEGSGTQFSPGDSTGGETVDWSTGKGNGGSSQCGQDAVVEYVCIDFMTEEGWKEWSCGYVTTC